MKKILSVFILAFIISFSGNSQITTYEDFIEYSKDLIIYKNAKKEKIDYEKTALSLANLYPLDKHDAVSRSIIYEVPGKTAEEIYVEVNNWFIHSFGSGKSVIQLNDKESGVVIGKGYVASLGTTVGFTNTSSAAAWVIIRIDIKDEKVRVIATIQSYEVTKTAGAGIALLGGSAGYSPTVVEYIPSKCYPYTKKEKGTGSKALTLAHCWIVTIFNELNDALNSGITGFEEEDF